MIQNASPRPTDPKAAIANGDKTEAEAAKIKADPPATTGNETERKCAD